MQMIQTPGIKVLTTYFLNLIQSCNIAPVDQPGYKVPFLNQ